MLKVGVKRLQLHVPVPEALLVAVPVTLGSGVVVGLGLGGLNEKDSEPEPLCHAVGVLLREGNVEDKDKLAVPCGQI